MPDIAKLLKMEIARVARKHARAECVALRQAVSKYRADIARLKCDVADLQRRQCSRGEAEISPLPVSAAAAADSPRTRYSAKSLSAQRRRLKLSAEELGMLLGVSGQTIYLWEADRTRPRPRHRPGIIALRSLSRAAALELLAQRR
jgi:hypothetical protein